MAILGLEREVCLLVLVRDLLQVLCVGLVFMFEKFVIPDVVDIMAYVLGVGNPAIK